MNDIREMAAIEGVDDIAEQILNKPIELFTNSELAQRFCNVDISYIRAVFYHDIYRLLYLSSMMFEANETVLVLMGCWYALL